MTGLNYQIDENGMIICVPIGPNTYITLNIEPNVLDEITKNWYANSKGEIITIPFRKKKNRVGGTIERG